MSRGDSAIVLRGPVGVGPTVEGETLVSRHGFNARYDLDRTRGIFSRPSHDLYGQSCAGKILVFSSAKGGIATSWALLDLKARGLAPKALIFRRTNPVMVQGAVLAEVPLLHLLEPDPVTTLRTGDWVRVEPERGLVEVVRHAAT
jgi:predicted aconitase with swiveling domain